MDDKRNEPSDPGLPLSPLDESPMEFESSEVPKRSADATSKAELLRESSPPRSGRSSTKAEDMIPPKLPPPPPPPPPGITATERRRRRARVARWLLPAAALIIGALIGWMRW